MALLIGRKGQRGYRAPNEIDSIDAISGATSFVRSSRGAEHPFQFVELDLGRFLRRNARHTLELLGERIERAVAVIGRALIANRACGVSTTSLASQAAKRDLPMPASPEISTIWPDLPRPALACEKFGALRLPTDEAGQPRGLRRVETALALGPPSAAKASTGSARPLIACPPKSFSRKRLPSSRRVVADTTTPPASARPCSRAARFGVSPTTTCSCEEPCPTISPATTMPVAIPTRTESSTRACLQGRHGFGDVQRCVDRPRRVVLMRAGKAKVSQDPVAEEFRDETVVARQHARAGVLIGVDDLAHVLGIEPRRERRRSDEVAEHDSELAPVGGVGR